MNFFGGSFNQLGLKLSYRVGVSIRLMPFVFKFKVKGNKT